MFAPLLLRSKHGSKQLKSASMAASMAASSSVLMHKLDKAVNAFDTASADRFTGKTLDSTTQKDG